MAYKIDRVCTLCNKKYQYCPHCGQFDHLPKWMTIVCSEQCHDVFMTLASYNIGKITKEEAREVLGKYPNMDTSNYTGHVQEEIKDIMTVPKKIKRKSAVKKNDEVIE